MRALVLLLLATSARADDLHVDYAIDGAVGVVAALGLISMENARRDLTGSCHWCERDAIGNPTLNAFDSAARNSLLISDTHAAAQASDILAYVVVPLVAVAGTFGGPIMKKRFDYFTVDALILIQTTLVAADLNDAVKFAVARERPLVHFNPGSDDARKSVSDRDSQTSFFSSHTTLTFAIATAAGTTASIRGYKLAPAIWALGMTAAATTGYLRIAADRHYLTDVLVGGAVGSLVGFINPYFIHSKHPHTRWLPDVEGVRGGAVLALRGSF